MSINKIRQEIDEIDRQLLKLLNLRAEKAIEIGGIKSRQELEVLDPHREGQIIERMTSLNPGPLSTEQITRLYEQVIRICRSLQS